MPGHMGPLITVVVFTATVGPLRTHGGYGDAIWDHWGASKRARYVKIAFREGGRECST